jgi:hypothetical protein
MKSRILYVCLLLAALLGCVTITPAQIYPSPGPGTAAPHSGGGVAVINVGTLASAFSKPYSITLTGNVSVNDMVFIECTGETNNSGTLFSFVSSDSGSNSWTYPTASTNTAQEVLNSGSGTVVGMMWMHATTALTSGTSTIQFNPSVDTAWGCNVFDVHGGSYTTLDQIASGREVTAQRKPAGASRQHPQRASASS